MARLFQLADGGQAVTAGALRGFKDTRVPMVIALAGYWIVGIGTAVLLAFPLGWGGVGVWSGLALGLAVVWVALLLRFRALTPWADAERPGSGRPFRTVLEVRRVGKMWVRSGRTRWGARS